MTDQDLERRLRAWYRAEIADGERAPHQLRADLAMLAGTTSSRRPLTAGWRFSAMHRFAPVAFAATAVVVVILIGIGLILRAPDIGPSPIPGPTHSATLEPSATSEPPVPAAWTATASMADARMDFTATLLPDGKVLVAGGDRGFDAVPRALASAELYDPATGTWSATGSMLTGRYRHTATLLPDGKVLVAGGNVDSSAKLGGDCCLASSELYDPASGTWTATQSMVDARVAHTATLLLNGTVLVAGGDSAHINGTVPGAELYDPITGTWTPTGSMNRHDHSATLLSDGRVFVVGGSAPQDASELYDPRTGFWSETDCCTDDPTRFGPFRTATLLPDGQVLVAGGLAYATDADKESGPTIVATPAAALYDPRIGHWTATGSMVVAREEFTAVLLPDGKVLAMGGSETFATTALTAAELYDPSSGSWTATASMIEARFAQEAVLLLDGRVLVVGGTSAFVGGVGFVPLPSAELYDPGSGS